MTGRGTSRASDRRPSPPPRPSGVRWWGRRTTQGVAMGALMLVALALGPETGVLPSLPDRLDGVQRITNMIDRDNAPEQVHTR